MNISRGLRRRLLRGGFLKEDVTELVDSTVSFVLEGYEAVLLLTLYDKLGFGNKRAKRLLKQVRNTFDSVQQGYVSIEDIKEEVKKTIKIDIGKDFIEEDYDE